MTGDSLLCATLTAAVLTLPAPAAAQPAGAAPVGGALLLTTGVAGQPYVFGDDAPRRNTGAGFTIGFQGWKSLSASRAVVLEVAFHPTAVENPWFPERVRVVHMLVGVEFGGRTYVRPAAGIGLSSWSAFRAAEGSVEAGLAIGVAVGYRVALGERWQTSPEGFFRATAGPGFATPSFGVQIALGRRTR